MLRPLAALRQKADMAETEVWYRSVQSARLLRCRTIQGIFAADELDRSVLAVREGSARPTRIGQGSRARSLDLALCRREGNIRSCCPGMRSGAGPFLSPSGGERRRRLHLRHGGGATPTPDADFRPVHARPSAGARLPARSECGLPRGHSSPPRPGEFWSLAVALPIGYALVRSDGSPRPRRLLASGTEPLLRLGSVGQAIFRAANDHCLRLPCCFVPT